MPPIDTELAKAGPNAGSSQSPAAAYRPPSMKRAWSSEPGAPKFDKLGRRILANPPASRPGSRAGSAASSTPGTPRRGEFDVSGPSRDQVAWPVADARGPPCQAEDDFERASTLMALYDIRAKIRQQDNSSLIKAREKINALAAKQQAQQAAERNMKAAEELRRNRYSFPKPGS